VDSVGVFHKIPRSDDSRLAEIFAREVLSFLVGRELLSPEWAERLLSWPHTVRQRLPREGQEGAFESVGTPGG